MSNICINIKGLYKKFVNKEIFIDANVAISQNSITALSGPNASGKTTLLKLISGLLLPEKGEITVYGYSIYNPKKVKQYCSVAFNTDLGFYPQLTLNENLNFLSRIYANNSDIVKFAIDKLQLNPYLNDRFALVSSGIKTRLWLVSTLIKQPKVLLIDELSKSVDYDAKECIYELINILKKEFKMTILFVSHDIEEIKKLSDSWIKIENYKLVIIK
ncbi:MAG: ATP-binding cassette domain-containing protein [Endomicrobia bacterium]|nr:ATP-binding cassette domain-containing protein [Endomicrobiia bacterium]